MTYNIRYNNPGDGVNAWPNRRDRLAALVRFQAPDVVGFQEALRGQVDDLAERLPGYEWVGVGRDDGADGGEFSPVFYRADRVELLDHGTFWLSDAPDEVGSVGWDAALPRVATWVRVSVDDQEYVVVNTHFDHVGEQARSNSAELIVTRAAAMAEGAPVVVLGDFNAAPDSAPYATLSEALSDARAVARDAYGPEETFFGFSVADTVGRRIDHVFVDARLSVSQFAVLTEHVRGRYLSDHLPVVADVMMRSDAAVLPLDPAVRHGKLDNGLTYYIRENARPEARAEIRLVVNAGSVLEDEDQLGLAHVVEHMAFNGTERFEKQDLIDYLETTGVRFGADLNAYTSFDETVYQLRVQTDSIELFDTGIDILREWASRVTFDPDEIERERGVVMEEWRIGRGAAARIRDAQFPVLLKGSRYADRLPIGTQESLANFDHDAVTRYYSEWYRPGLAAVVVVGDVDPDYAERRIREAFASWAPADDPRERDEYGVQDHDSTLVASVTDDEAQFSSVTVVYKHPEAPLKTEEDYRRWAVERLVHRMLNDRFEELTQSEDPPFFGAGSGKGGFARSKEFYNVSAIAVGDQILRALEAIVAEVERASRHGFTGTEVARAKASLLRSFETSFNERDKAESGSFVGEYVSHFLEGTAAPGIQFEYEFMQRTLPGITDEDLNDAIRGFVDTPSRVVLIDGPTGAAIPTDAEVLAVLDAVRVTELEPYVDNVSDAPLVAVPPDPGRVVWDSTDSSIGVTWWTLSNGARVILKPTDFKNDEILFAAHSPGGTSLVADELDVHADFASTLIGQGGVANFGPLELQKQLSGKIVQVQPTLGERSEGFFGRSSPQDVETMLQLAYLYVTQPRADTTAYLSLKQRYSSIIETLKSDPNRAFSDTLAVTLSQHHPRRQVLSRELLDELELTASHEIFAERFADVSDFTFYLVGAIASPDSIRPLVEQYIGGMPGAGREEEPRDLGIRPPTGHVERVVRRGQEPQSRVQIAITGKADWSHRNTRLIALIEGVLDIRLRELLREDLGGTYGVSVNGSLSSEPEERFTFMIGFACEPERVDELTQTVLDELDRFRREGAPEDDVVKVREKSRNAHETNLRENSYWLNSLMFYDRFDLNPQGIVDGTSAFFESTTQEDIVDAAQVYLDTTNMVRVILVPESAAGTSSGASGGASGDASDGPSGHATDGASGG